MKVVVYVPKADERKLQEQGKDPAVWVRALVKHALGKM
jgi:hypothetical protein